MSGNNQLHASNVLRAFTGSTPKQDELENLASRATRILGSEVSPSSLCEPETRFKVFAALLDATGPEDSLPQATCDLLADMVYELGPSEGVWAVRDASGEMCGVADVHLCTDDDSPYGLAWDYRVALVSSGSWDTYDGGIFWGYAAASDVVDLALVGDYFENGCRCVGLVPGVHDLEEVLETGPLGYRDIPSERLSSDNMDRIWQQEPREHPPQQAGARRRSSGMSL